MDTHGKWAPISPDKRASEKLWGASSTYSRDVFRRLFSNIPAVASMVIILLLAVFAIAGPMMSSHTYNYQELAYVNLPPTLTVAENDGRYFFLSQSMAVIEVSADGELLAAHRVSKENMDEKEFYYDVEDLVVSYKQLPATMMDGDGNKLIADQKIRNTTYILGTDNLGRDILVRLMYGARISLIVALIATVVNFVIGVLYGGISGYVGGNVDIIMMRIVDIISTIPLTLYVILIMVVIGSTGFTSIILALGSVYWVGMARMVRGQVLALKEQEYVNAARTIGTSTWRILIKHLIPNALSAIVVMVTMNIPSAIFTESFLSFIGLGVSAPMASWGTLCSDSLEYLRTAPYQLIAPATAICITMFAFNFLGDGLRDALDPKTRK